MSSYTKDLLAYAKKYPETHIKNRFFHRLVNLIEKNQLTVATLTSELRTLSSKERKELFATRLGITAAIDGGAANLIKDLYKGLGAKLNKSTGNALINGTHIDKKQIAQLLNARYNQWLKEPLHDDKKRALEHELKGHLGLNTTEHKNISLIKVLLTKWQTYDRFIDKEQFKNDLNSLVKIAPEYMPLVLEKIYLESLESVKPEYIELILELAKENYEIRTALLNTHPALVTAWIRKYPKEFFKLEKPMQTAVLKELDKLTDQKTIDEIAVSAKKVAHIDIKLLSDALLDKEIRTDLSAYKTQKLKNDLAELMGDKAKMLIQRDQNIEALRIITKYRLQLPNQYKRDFFTHLSKAINEKGLSVSLLNEHLQHANSDKLFAKWSGLEHSRAAGIMASLYKVASLGETMTPEQITQMVQGNLLPYNIPDHRKFLEQQIQTIVTTPDKATRSHLTHYVKDVLGDLQNRAQFLANRQHHSQHNAEALYQQYILNKGLELACASENPVFDPQGHVILFVRLDESNYQEILVAMGGRFKEGSSAKEQVESLLGTKVTDSTLCNLDIKNNDPLKIKFAAWLNNDKAYRSLMSKDSDERSSMIQLQQEMAMHVLLSLRVLEHKIPSHQLNQELRDNLPLEINQLVRMHVQEALKTACPIGHTHVDYSVLNEALDKARKPLAIQCREKLAELVQETYPETNWTKEIESLKKHDFTSTTATGLDYLHSDARNQTVIRISATDHTAHDKKIGKHNQAFRVLHRNHYQANGSVVPYATRTIEARVPSIADKSATQHKSVVDVAAKLHQDHSVLRAQSEHGDAPMVYNLLTSLHTFVYDISPFERSNRQRLSAEYILQGSHLYNLQQVRAGEISSLVYVQNIPVNQHTNKLDDAAFDDVTKEATLMTDMALLSTLRHHAALFPCEIQRDLNKTYSFAHQKYVSFLPEAEQSGAYFHKTEAGHVVRDALKKHKKEWTSAHLNTTPHDTMDTLVIKALFKMYSQNMHRDTQFGMLAQALSIYVEPISLSGCKSANERYQAVSGRVELLKSIGSRSFDKLSVEEREVKNALRDIIDRRGSFAKLQEHLDKAYNLHNLQGAVAAVSMEDQGASSKVQATKNRKAPGVITELNTNIAETGFLSRLHQTCSSAMQSHKANLAGIFKQLFKPDKHTEKKSMQV